MERNHFKSSVTAYDFSSANPARVSDNYPRPALSAALSSPEVGDKVLADGSGWGPDGDGNAEEVIYNGVS